MQGVDDARVRSDTSRAAWLRHAMPGLGGLAAVLGVGAGFAAASGSAPSRDREILQLGLVLERLQAAFYGAALRGGNLTGEVHQFAVVVGGHEAEHESYLQRRLGGPAGRAPGFRFGNAASTNASFLAAAVKLEEAGLAAYNGQTSNLTADGLRYVAPIISVEARHVAWARDLAGMVPAPAAVDTPVSAARALQAVRTYLAHA